MSLLPPPSLQNWVRPKLDESLVIQYLHWIDLDFYFRPVLICLKAKQIEYLCNRYK